MGDNFFIQALAFVITLLITDLIENIFLINYGNGKIKFRFSLETLNPFIKKEKALLIWVVQLLVSGLLSIPVGKYFEAFISSNIFYYIPILCLSIIALIILGAKNLGIKMSRTLWKVIIGCMIVFIISLFLLTNGKFSNLKPITLINKG